MGSKWRRPEGGGDAAREKCNPTPGQKQANNWTKGGRLLESYYAESSYVKGERKEIGLKLHIKSAALRRLRLEKALTREQLAEVAGVSKYSLDQYEAGNRTACQVQTVRKLAGALAVEPERISAVRGSRAKRADKLQSV